jgi:hypothetical protein
MNGLAHAAYLFVSIKSHIILFLYQCLSAFICGFVLLEFLVGAGFGGGVHAVLRDFVDASRGGFLVNAVEMIERAWALSDGITFFDGLGHIRFSEQHGFPQRAAAGKLRGNRRRERAS